MAADYTLRQMWQIDREVLGNLSRELTGSRISPDEVVKTATLIGRVGRVVHGKSSELVLGFAAGKVTNDRLVLRWLVASPLHRIVVLRILVNSLRKEFPDIDIVVRVPNNDGKYEFLADLKDASGLNVVPDASSTTKVTDESASYIHVYLREPEDKGDPGSSGFDRQTPVVRDSRHGRRS